MIFKIGHHCIVVDLGESRPGERKSGGKMMTIGTVDNFSGGGHGGLFSISWWTSPVQSPPPQKALFIGFSDSVVDLVDLFFELKRNLKNNNRK